MAGLWPSLTTTSVIYMTSCAREPDYYCQTKCDSSGKDTKKNFTNLSIIVFLYFYFQINCQYFTDFEKPGEFVVSKAREIKADVIVMGTRGMGKIRRTLLGSVSDFVVSHAPCPVLICRNKED